MLKGSRGRWESLPAGSHCPEAQKPSRAPQWYCLRLQECRYTTILLSCHVNVFSLLPICLVLTFLTASTAERHMRRPAPHEAPTRNRNSHCYSRGPGTTHQAVGTLFLKAATKALHDPASSAADCQCRHHSFLVPKRHQHVFRSAMAGNASHLDGTLQCSHCCRTAAVALQHKIVQRSAAVCGYCD